MDMKYVRLVREEEIPWYKRIFIRILNSFGFYGIKAYKDNIQKNSIEYYYGYCEEHGYFINSPQGIERNLHCPLCK